jgi:ornithine cyclodeaminase/alanine dehydrogenase-like protein (mu-crystallin family)
MSRELLSPSRADVGKAGLSMRGTITAVEAGIREKGQGRTEMPPTIGIHPAPRPTSTPCRRATSAGAVAIEWASIFLESLGRNLPP